MIKCKVMIFRTPLLRGLTGDSSVDQIGSFIKRQITKKRLSIALTKTASLRIGSLKVNKISLLAIFWTRWRRLSIRIRIGSGKMMCWGPTDRGSSHSKTSRTSWLIKTLAKSKLISKPHKKNRPEITKIGHCLRNQGRTLHKDRDKVASIWRCWVIGRGRRSWGLGRMRVTMRMKSPLFLIWTEKSSTRRKRKRPVWRVSRARFRHSAIWWI